MKVHIINNTEEFNTYNQHILHSVAKRRWRLDCICCEDNTMVYALVVYFVMEESWPE
jgi:hypothetical protein